MKKTSKIFGIIAIVAVIGFAAISMIGCSSPGGGGDTGGETPVEKSLVSISITTPPTKIEYNLNEELDTTGMVVTAMYDDDTEEDVTDYTTSGFDSATEGEKTVTVTYEGKTAEFNVIVIDLSKLYIITGSGAAFTATRGGEAIGTAGQSIQDVINAIRTHSAGADAVIRFGSGAAVLDIGTASASFNGTWGEVTLLGKITSAVTSNYTTDTITGTIAIADSVCVNSMADIANTVNNGNGVAISTASTGGVEISGGTVSAIGGIAVYNNSTGTITVSGAAIITSANMASASGNGGTIFLANKGDASTVSLVIEGGTIGNTGAGFAIINKSPGVLNISGGTVENTSTTTGVTIRNESTGTINISGGTVSATRGAAVYNASTGKITVSGDAWVTSSSTNTIYINDSGDATEERLVITGGTVENTGNIGQAIYNNSTGAVTISGGTVKATSSGYALFINSTGAINITEPPAVINGKRRLQFTTVPVLKLEPENAKIVYTWTASVPAADSYDVYYKEGNNVSAVTLKINGTKITNAVSGGTISGLTNDTDYSVLVTANKKDTAKNIEYISDSAVHTTMPIALYYAITRSGTTFTATKNNAAFVTTGTTIQAVIDAIRTDVNGKACIVHFGEEEPINALDIGTATASFSGAWGLVRLSGKITGNSTNSAIDGTNGTIAIADAVSITSTADIANTTAGANAKAIYNNSTGTLIISDGEVKANTGIAIYNANTGKITVSGTAKVTSANVTTTSGTINIANSGTATDPRLVIEGGTVENTSTGTNGRAIYNVSTGTVNISGGTVSVTTGVAVYNANTGKITVSGTAKITSADANTSLNSGTIVIANSETATDARLEITGGIVEVTSTGSNGKAIYNGSTGAVNISGGTVSATTGKAVHSNYFGKITVSGTAKITSANVNNTSGTIYIATTSGTATDARLEITGGTVENTASLQSYDARVVYNASSGTVTISGGTVQTTGDSSYVVNNASTGVVNISGGTIQTTGGSARAVNNNSTGTVNISGGTVSATTGPAAYNNSTGKITVSGTAKLSSTGTSTTGGTIVIADSGTTTAERLEITGGSVENTSTDTGNAIRNNSTGAVTISGGKVLKAGSGDYSIYNNSSGVITIGSSAVIVGRTYPPIFTESPVLSLEPGNGTITYKWTAPTPTPDSYDVYWKAGNLSVAEVKTGTKITGAASGGSITTGLVNGTTYSVVVTANKATTSDIDSIDSWVLTAKPGSPVYIITESSGSFIATKSGVTTAIETSTSIQTVIDTVRSNANGAACVIQFGDGAVLDIGATSISLSGAWGMVDLSGKIKGSSATTTTGTIAIDGNISINSSADIANTVSSGNAIYNNSTGVLSISSGMLSVTANSGHSILNNSTGTLTITGGTISAKTGSAVYNNAGGAVTISGGTLSATGDMGYTVYNNSTGTISISGGSINTTSNLYTMAVRNNGAGTINISGGSIDVDAMSGNNNIAVHNASTGEINISGGSIFARVGYAVNNFSTGTINISGGTVRANASDAAVSVVRNEGAGTINISGGTVSSSSGTVVRSGSTGKIIVSGTARITSANTSVTSGTIIASSGTATTAWLEITGGTIENTSTGANGNAIYNNSAGAITMNGGTVSTTATSGRAINNNSTGALTISNGTVRAPVNETAYAIYNNSTGTVTVTSPPAVIVGARYP